MQAHNDHYLGDDLEGTPGRHSYRESYSHSRRARQPTQPQLRFRRAPPVTAVGRSPSKYRRGTVSTRKVALIAAVVFLSLLALYRASNLVLRRRSAADVDPHSHLHDASDIANELELAQEAIAQQQQLPTPKRQREVAKPPAPASHGHDDELVHHAPAAAKPDPAIARWNHLSAGGHLFEDELTVLLYTTKEHHQLAQRAKQTWGRFVKHFHIFSNAEDAELNTIVSSNADAVEDAGAQPHEFTLTADALKSPGALMLPSILKHTHSQLQNTPLYILLDDTTFPLLDIVKRDLDKLQMEAPSSWPPAVLTGRPNQRQVGSTMFAEQHDAAATFYSSKPGRKLVSYPTMIAFSRQWLNSVMPYLNTHSCPLLSPIDMAVAAINYCAAIEPADIKTDFLTQTRYSPREKSINPTTPVTEWREVHAYHNLRDVERVDEAFVWYYKQLGTFASAITLSK